MRYLACIILFLIGCSDDGSTPAAPDYRQTCQPDSIYVAEWTTAEDSNNLIVDSDCTGYGGVCSLEFNYYKPVNGKVLIDVTAVNQPGGDSGTESCLSIGEATCDITYQDDGSDEYLYLNCGGGVITYTFWADR